jgi:hypothetical protein
VAFPKQDDCLINNQLESLNFKVCGLAAQAAASAQLHDSCTLSKEMQRAHYCFLNCVLLCVLLAV